MCFTKSTPGRGLVLDILNKYTLEEPCPRKTLSFIKSKFAYVLQLQNVTNIALLDILVPKRISYVWRWNVLEFWGKLPSLSHTMDLPIMFTIIGAMLKTQVVGCEDSLEHGINYSASLFVNSNTTPSWKTFRIRTSSSLIEVMHVPRHPSRWFSNGVNTKVDI